MIFWLAIGWVLGRHRRRIKRLERQQPPTWQQEVWRHMEEMGE